MKYLTIILFTGIVLINSSCRKSAETLAIPECIKSTLQANSHNADWAVGSIEEYRFQGQIVYAFNPDHNIIADGATMIQTESCNNLCTIGGYGGPSVYLCNGENFFEKAVLIRKVWEKNKK